MAGLMRAHNVDEHPEMVARRAAPSTWAAIVEDVSVSFHWCLRSPAFRAVVDVGGDAYGGIDRGMAVLGRALVELAGRCVLLRFSLDVVLVCSLAIRGASYDVSLMDSFCKSKTKYSSKQSGSV
jgi:hypothetical protein